MRHRLWQLSLATIVVALLVGCAAAEPEGTAKDGEASAQVGSSTDADAIRQSISDQWDQLNDPAVQVREPFQVFDNLWYIGIDWVSMWLLETSDGLVLLDALYDQFIDVGIENVGKLGFDIADVKYVLVTHAHMDHAGGAKRIQDLSGARVVMTEKDWELSRSEWESEAMRFDAPETDFVARDGDVIELGDTKIELFVTPGHTEGVLSMRFDVRDGDDVHTAFTFGGVGLNFDGVARTQSYIESVKRVQEMTGIAVNVPNHAGAGRVFERAAALESRQPGEAHPFVDPAAWQASLARWLSRAEEKLEAERAKEGSAEGAD